MVSTEKFQDELAGIQTQDFLNTSQILYWGKRSSYEFLWI